MQTIKAVARRRWQDDARRHHSWYEPLADDGALARAVRHVLAHSQLFLNTSSDSSRLRPTLEAAEAAAGADAGAPSDAELERDVEACAMRAAVRRRRPRAHLTQACAAVLASSLDASSARASASADTPRRGAKT